jgi:7-cyano-7-deazaguanine synthase in queuosine biosynthesis
MNSEKFIICGNVHANLPADVEADALRLHLDGKDDENKITLRVEDIRSHIYKEVPSRLLDLLMIATYVCAADQAIIRGAEDAETFGSKWRRNLHFVIPVSDVEFWSLADVVGCLKDTLGFLSDDRFEFDFLPFKDHLVRQSYFSFNNDGLMLGKPEQVVMFSGGLDSLGGAVDEVMNQKRRVLLVNHRATQKFDKRYLKMCGLLDAKAPNNRPFHVRVTVHKKKWMNKEYTQRTRSFLFVSLGACIANMLGQSSVRFYENGVISLNLPMASQVVGSKATRTTHPRVFHGFQQLLSMVTGSPFTVENPFLWKTKGEIVDLIAKSGCQELIGSSTSCAHVWEMTQQYSHCGTCSQCLDRRFAVIANGLEAFDPLENYKVDLFYGVRDETRKVHEDKTLYAGYLERANQAERIVQPTQFLVQFPEVARALRYLGGDSGANLQRCHEMYKRHASEAASVIEKSIAHYVKAIRQRTLPADSLMRIMYESNLPTSVSAVPAQAEPLPDNVFRLCGGAWQVRFEKGSAFIVLPKLGARYIHHLLMSPNEPQSAIDIVCRAEFDECDRVINEQEAIEAGLQSRSNPRLDNMGEIVDRKAFEGYRAKYRELSIALARAQQDQDTVIIEECESELALLKKALSEVTGVGGKLKKAGDKIKTIRDGFRNAVNRVIDQHIKNTDPLLAKHLKKQLKFGNEPCYFSTEGVVWETRPVKNV